MAEERSKMVDKPRFRMSEGRLKMLIGNAKMAEQNLRAVSDMRRSRSMFHPGVKKDFELWLYGADTER